MLTLAQTSLIPLYIVGGYLALLLVLGITSTRFFRGTSADYFVASRSIGPFMLLMSVFGTTMTGFALVGSTAKSFESGIGVYGLMASWSGLVHSACFFLVGIKLWAIGKRHGYVTQCQFFRKRFDSSFIGYLLFPILVALIIPYLLVGIIAACRTMVPITIGMFPEAFAATRGALPPWLTGLVICAVVLCYVFFGGVRSTAWANTFQTLVFMAMGVVTFFLISRAMGGLAAATQTVAEHAPEKLAREGQIGKWQFATYLFIPLSVGMFPHLFQHWLTARTAKSFRLTVVAHPIFIAIVWVPCILVGMWAAGLYAAGDLKMPMTPDGHPIANAALGRMVATLVHSDILTGLLTAGILAAIMSSLDSQFVCIGSMFTNDIVIHAAGEDRFTDKQKLWIGRGFVVCVVAIAYGLSMALLNTNVFDLGVWCFSGFGALFPIVVASLYWKRTTAAAVKAAIIVTAGVWFYYFHQSGYGGETLLFTETFSTEDGHDGIMPVAVITLACAVTVVVVSLFTKPPKQETIDRFFPKALEGLPT